MQSQSDSDTGNSLELEAKPEATPSSLELVPLEPEAAEAPAPEPEPEPEPEPGLSAEASGEILRKAREARGESLNDIARTLKIAAHQLEAIENGRFDVLPGPTFARGFLRNYARYLDVPPEPLLESVSARTPTTADLASMLKLDGNVQPGASPRPASKALPIVLIVLAVLAVLAGLVWAGIHNGWFQFNFESPIAAQTHEKPHVATPVREKTPAAVLVHEHEQPPETALVAEQPAVTALAPEQPPVADPAPERTLQLKPVVIKLEQPVPVNIAPESSKDPLQASANAAAGVPPVPNDVTLRLLFKASTLAQVRDSSGTLVFTRIGAKGSSHSVKGRPPLSVMVNKASNVKLEFNGEAVDLKGHTNRNGVAQLTLQ